LSRTLPAADGGHQANPKKLPGNSRSSLISNALLATGIQGSELIGCPGYGTAGKAAGMPRIGQTASKANNPRSSFYIVSHIID